MMHTFSDLVVALAINIPMPGTKRKQKPEVSIIGAGRLGTTLAVALARRNYSIRSVVARRARNARKADEQALEHATRRSICPSVA